MTYVQAGSAALTATVISYRSRSAIREVGKVFGLTEDITGRLADTVWGHHGGKLNHKQVRQSGSDPTNDAIARAVHFAGALAARPVGPDLRSCAQGGAAVGFARAVAPDEY